MSNIKGLIYNTLIPSDRAIQNSVESKIPVVLHDIKSSAAVAYIKAAEELHLFFKKRGVL